MKGVSNSSKASLLALGDLVAYVFALILTLAVRYGEIPGRNLFASHISPFLLLFILFLLVSYSAGLFDKQSSFIKSGIIGLLIKVQIVNVFIGIAFFYLAPVAITPKANLAIYFIVSTVLLVIWRMVMFPVLSIGRPLSAILIGEGKDLDELYKEVNSNPRYGITFREFIKPSDENALTVRNIESAIERNKPSIIVANLRSPSVDMAMPFLYSKIFAGLQIMNARNLYESIFDRIPLSMVGERWFVENAGSALGGRRMYDSLKRLMDIVIAGIAGLISLVIYPFIYIAIKIDDGGPVFITQERIGKNGRKFKIHKFRSMTSNDAGSYGDNQGRTSLQITRVGKFIRLTRIDELPQLWSVLLGEQSLIGPRPELPALVHVYEKEIPYYGVRHLIKPGLSGWAQIYHHAHPHHHVAVENTRDKLSYDLFYIKNRSLGLDIRIALQTARAVLSRQGV